MEIRRLTHINGTHVRDLFHTCGCGNSPRILLETVDDQLDTKQSFTDLPDEHGAVAGSPYRGVRRVTIRGLISGSPCCMDEAKRFLERLFRLQAGTLALGFSEQNLAGVQPHWTLHASVTDPLILQALGTQNAVRWQAILTAADPHFYGRTFTYELSEGYAIDGKAHDFAHPVTYGAVDYVKSLTVYLEGSIDSQMQVTLNGPAVNPRILNVTTGEYLHITGTLGVSDVLTVSASSVVQLNGQYRNTLKNVEHPRLPVLVPGVNELVVLDDSHPLEDAAGPTATIQYTTRD